MAKKIRKSDAEELSEITEKKGNNIAIEANVGR
jgi:hypothetical protein